MSTKDAFLLPLAVAVLAVTISFMALKTVSPVYEFHEGPAHLIYRCNRATGAVELITDIPTATGTNTNK